MANTLKPKRSTVAGRVPTITDLISGEFGVNLPDQKLYINNGTSIVQIGAGKLTALGDVSVSSPSSGQLLSWNGTSWVNTSNLGGLIVDNAMPYLTWSGATAPTYAVGRVFYDSDYDSLAYYNGTSGNEVLIGQQTQLFVRNETGATITKGQVCYISGRSGSTPLVRLAKADSLSTAGAVGFANQDIANNTSGYLVILGSMFNLNTSGFSPGTTLYLSATTAGAFTDVQPAAPNYAVRVGFSLYNNVSQGSLFASFRPVYVSASNVIGTFAGLSLAIATKSAAYTATTSDYTILGNASTAAFSVTLPTAVGNSGRVFAVKKIDSSANAVTLATTSSQTIDGATSRTLPNQWDSLTVQSDGTNWVVLGGRVAGSLFIA